MLMDPALQRRQAARPPSVWLLSAVAAAHALLCKSHAGGCSPDITSILARPRSGFWSGFPKDWCCLNCVPLELLDHAIVQAGGLPGRDVEAVIKSAASEVSLEGEQEPRSSRLLAQPPRRPKNY